MARPLVASERRRSGDPDAARILGQLVLAFSGRRLPSAVRDRLQGAPVGGISLFRHHNVTSPGQVRELTDAIERAARARPGPWPGPLLIATDQEGGQLIGLGEATTPFAGNMALGAAGDVDLTERVARAIGTEARAMGVTLDYAPSCDVASNPANPALGIRSFGDDPVAVGRLAAAFVRGLHAAGVAATAKHFPGLGDVSLDSHHHVATVDHPRERLERVELPPFRAAIAAGADVVMSAHVAVTAITGDPALPATLSRAAMHDLLRTQLGYGGLTITDALDMHAIPQGSGQGAAVVAALRAGVDLLLCGPDEEARARIETALLDAVAEGTLEQNRVESSVARVAALRTWLAGFAQPDLDAVGSAGHAALARELATRSITLVRDDAALLPLRPNRGLRIAAIMPRPSDLTPADTSSLVEPGLADALRARHPDVEAFITGHPPTDAEISALGAAAENFGLLVVGTIAASFDAQQAALVQTLLSTGVPVVTVALRTPFDLAAYPGSATHLCSYGILRPSLDALADVLFGAAAPQGRLPAAVPGLYPTGHGLP
jgi:beta-N-acetylhexosaminidase